MKASYETLKRYHSLKENLFIASKQSGIAIEASKIVSAHSKKVLALCRPESSVTDSCVGNEAIGDRAETFYQESDLVVDHFSCFADIAQRVVPRLNSLGFFQTFANTPIKINASGEYDAVSTNFTAGLVYLQEVIQFVVKHTPRETTDPATGTKKLSTKENSEEMVARKIIRYQHGEFAGQEHPIYYSLITPSLQAAVAPLWRKILSRLPRINKVKKTPYVLKEEDKYKFVFTPGHEETSKIFGYFDSERVTIPKIKTIEEALSVFSPIQKMVDTIHFDETIGAGSTGYIASLFGVVLQDLQQTNVSPLLYFYSSERGAGKSTAVYFLSKLAEPDQVDSYKLTYKEPQQFKREFSSALDHSGRNIIELANVDENIDSSPILADYITCGTIAVKHTGETRSSNITSNTIIAATGADYIPSGADFLSRTLLISLLGRNNKKDKGRGDYDWFNFKVRLLRIAEFFLKTGPKETKKFQRFTEWSNTSLRIALSLGLTDTVSGSGVGQFVSARKDRAYTIMSEFLCSKFCSQPRFTSKDVLDSLMTDANNEVGEAYTLLSGYKHAYINTIGKFLNTHAKKLLVEVIEGSGKNPNKYCIHMDTALPTDGIPSVPSGEGFNVTPIETSRDAIDSFKASHDIVEIAKKHCTGRPTKIDSRGEVKMSCCFHDEKTPSLSLNSAKGMFHCYGCGAEGDVITFISLLENKTFPEVISEVSGKDAISYVKKVKIIQPEEEPFAVLDFIKRIATKNHTLGVSAVRRYFKDRLQSSLPAYNLGAFRYDDRRRIIMSIVMTEGKATGLHRLYLNDVGDDLQKIDGKRVRKMLGRVSGGAVQLTTMKSSGLFVTEGIETGLAVLSMVENGEKYPIFAGKRKYDVFAALSSSGVGKLKLPPHVKHVIVCKENDAASEKAYEALVDRYRDSDIKVGSYLPECGDFLDSFLAGSQ